MAVCEVQAPGYCKATDRLIKRHNKGCQGAELLLLETGLFLPFWRSLQPASVTRSMVLPHFLIFLNGTEKPHMQEDLVSQKD